MSLSLYKFRGLTQPMIAKRVHAALDMVGLLTKEKMLAYAFVGW